MDVGLELASSTSTLNGNEYDDPRTKAAKHLRGVFFLAEGSYVVGSKILDPQGARRKKGQQEVFRLLGIRIFELWK